MISVFVICPRSQMKNDQALELRFRRFLYAAERRTREIFRATLKLMSSWVVIFIDGILSRTKKFRKLNAQTEVEKYLNWKCPQ